MKAEMHLTTHDSHILVDREFFDWLKGESSGVEWKADGYGLGSITGCPVFIDECVCPPEGPTVSTDITTDNRPWWRRWWPWS